MPTTAPAPLSLPQRLSAALRVLRGQPDDARAIIPLTYPNFPGLAVEPQTPKDGTAQLSLVRTANPQEYKPDGAFIREQGFGKHPVVHACIRVIADVVASVPLVVLRERGNYESRVGDRHPLQQLLDYPAPRVSARTLRARMAVDFLGYGNAIAEIERDSPQGLPRRIKPINPESLQSVWVDTEGDARRYDYANWAGIIVYRDVADILHVRDIEMPRPFQPDVFGFPRGAAALASIAADNEATKYVRQVVSNDGTPTFAVLLADEATQDDAAAMQDRYKARVVDRGKRGTPAFFGSVKDIKPLGFTLSDLEFPDLRRVSREDICAVFGVDPRMIGIASATSDAGLSGAQYVEARARLVQHTVEPLMAAIEDELNHWLAPEFGNVWISYDHDILRDLVENDETTSTRIRAEFAASLRTWEESRRALKLSPLPEPTDTLLMSGTAKLVPAAVAVIDPSQVIDQAPATDNEPASPEPNEDEAEEDEEDEPLEDEDTLDRAVGQIDAVSTVVSPNYVPADQLPSPNPLPPLEDAEGRPYWVHHPEVLDKGPRREEDSDILFRYWKRATEFQDTMMPRFESTALALFTAQRRDVARMFGDAEGRAVRADDPILAEIDRRIRANYAPGGDYHVAWREAYLDLIETMYLSGAKMVAGVGFSFGLKTPEVLAAIERRAAQLATFVGETTAQQATAAILAGERAGLSVQEIGRLIARSVYGPEMTRTRADRIARTETAGAQSQGSWDQAQDMGDLYRSKEWLAFTDGKTRPTHSMAMGQGRIAMDAAFANGLRYSSDPAGSAAEVVNCFPAGTVVEGKVVGGLKAAYSGQLREIITKGGKRLTLTPNHPVLAERGWVPAAMIAEGDNLFSYGAEAVSVAPGVIANDEQNPPARIEDVFDAMASDGGILLLDVSELDLHGDAVGAKGPVHIVRSNGKLKGEIGAAFADGVQEDNFLAAHSGISARHRLGPLNEHGERVFLTSTFSVGGGHLSSNEGRVALDLVPLEPLRIGSTAHGDPVFAQPSKEERAAVPEFIRELLEAHAGLVQLDEVVQVRDFDATCHVFDLETVDGWMIANGIVTSNCRCTMAYFTDPVEGPA